MRKLATFLAVLSLLAIGALIFVVAKYQPDHWEEELTKSLLQVVVVVVRGQSASLLVAENTRKRQRREAIAAVRSTTLVRLNQAYSEAKKIRRLMRIHGKVPVYRGDSPQGTITHAAYDQGLQSL